MVYVHKELTLSFDFTQSAFTALREKAIPDTTRLVIWCGAGLGRPANLPSWLALRRTLDNRLREKGRFLDSADRASLERRANSIQGEKNPWVAFQRLEKELGSTTYRDTIREALEPAITSAIPNVYLQLWRLRIAGMITLNLDSLAQRAYSATHSGKSLITFSGKQLGPHLHVLKNPNVPFLCHLHGFESDTTSWVFTHNALSELFKMDAYIPFINSVLTQCTVVFVGLSADDVAVGSHLKRVADMNFDFGSHFWVTHRMGRDVDRWAESAGLRTILYRASDNDHSELSDMLEHLTSYVPEDDRSIAYPPALVGSSLTPVRSLPSPDEVRKMGPDEIRTILNQKALDILRLENPNRDQEFKDFVRAYDYPIHNAWYVSTDAGQNTLVGYTLKERCGKGAFGQIFKAEAPDGSPVAIKLLKAEIRTDPQLLHSFRRGVRAMRILNENNVQGMVAYKEASEIPAFVAMDWIDGYNLRQAIEMNLLSSWEATLAVALRIATILKTAHSLPERVLHRDLRPANIMIRKDKSGRHWNVYLLDFDLSWYLGSIEQSVIHGSDAYGYLAPEQTHRRAGASSRHPAVDSYGLGMTFYFMLSGVDPSPEQHLRESWGTDVRTAAMRRQCTSWVSIPNRFARLIQNMTRDRQSTRWDLAQIVLELQQLISVTRRQTEVPAADMIAEELAAKSTALSGYLWDADKQAAVLEVSQAGVTIELAGDGTNHRVGLQVAKIRTEADERVRSAKRMNEAGQRMAEILRGARWEVETNKAGNERILIVAHMDIGRVASDIKMVARSIDRVVEAMPRMY